MATESDTQQWSTAVVSYSVNDDLTLSLTSRIRLENDISEVKDLLVGPALALRVTPNLSLGFGYDHIHDYRPDTDNENRPWQSVTLSHRTAQPSLHSRLRLDERMIDGVDGTIFRARYRLRGTYDLAARPWYLAASDEVFVNLNSESGGPRSGFSQNRLYLGMGRSLWDRTNLEFGYQWGYQERRGENLVTHAILLTLSLSLGGP